MAALTDVINFLLGLMGDEGKQLEFDENPDKALQDAGLDGITGQDVRDAQLEMCDRGLAGPNGGGGGSGGGGSGGGGSGGGGGGGGGRHSGGDDPVQAIQHTTATLHVTQVTETNIITIDDRDTIFNDSFNSDDDVTIIDDSFNDSSSVVNDVTAIQDNDTIINDNDTVIIEDGDTTTGAPTVEGPENTGVVGPGVGTPENPPLGIATEDIVAPEADAGPDLEGEVETQVEPEAEPAEAFDDEPELDADVEAAVEPEPVDAAIV